MPVSKTPHRPKSALPPIGKTKKKQSKPGQGKVTVVTEIPFSLPPIEPNSKIYSDRYTGDCPELWKKYEDLLNENMINEAIIEKRAADIDKQLRDIEQLQSQAVEIQREVAKVTKEHAGAKKIVRDIEEENTRLRLRKYEQALEVSLLEGKNKTTRSELRDLLNKISDAEKRIERGPEYIREEAERCQREAAELEVTNEELDWELKGKKAELNDIRIELIMKDSDSDGDSENENEEDNGDGLNTKIENVTPIRRFSPIKRSITPPLIIPALEPNVDARLDIQHNDFFKKEVKSEMKLPLIEPSKINVGQNEINRKVKQLREPLPDIKILGSSVTNPKEISRNIFLRGTSAATKTACVPKPPVSGVPTVATRRRRIKR